MLGKILLLTVLINVLYGDLTCQKSGCPFNIIISSNGRGCYCDSICQFVGDCCEDVCIYCPQTFCSNIGSCINNCGNIFQQECRCDPDCRDRGDCCTDYCNACAPESETCARPSAEILFYDGMSNVDDWVELGIWHTIVEQFNDQDNCPDSSQCVESVSTTIPTSITRTTNTAGYINLQFQYSIKIDDLNAFNGPKCSVSYSIDGAPYVEANSYTAINVPFVNKKIDIPGAGSMTSIRFEYTGLQGSTGRCIVDEVYLFGMQSDECPCFQTIPPHIKYCASVCCGSTQLSTKSKPPFPILTYILSDDRTCEFKIDGETLYKATNLTPEQYRSCYVLLEKPVNNAECDISETYDATSLINGMKQYVFENSYGLMGLYLIFIVICISVVIGCIMCLWFRVKHLFASKDFSYNELDTQTN